MSCFYGCCYGYGRTVVRLNAAEGGGGGENPKWGQPHDGLCCWWLLNGISGHHYGVDVAGEEEGKWRVRGQFEREEKRRGEEGSPKEEFCLRNMRGNLVYIIRRCSSKQ
jgi:hypothetical protein